MQQHVDLDQVAGLLADRFVVERRVALGARLESVEEVEHDLGQRQRVAQLDAVRGQVVHALQRAATGLAELHDRADVVRGRQDRGPYDRLVDFGDLAVAGILARVGDGDLRAVLHHDAVDHVGHGRDEVEVELALQPLAHDLHVQQAEEAATEAEAERAGGLRLVHQRGVVELQLVERVAQRRVVVAVDRVEAGVHHRVGVPVATERLGRRRGSRT